MRRRGTADSLSGTGLSGHPSDSGYGAHRLGGKADTRERGAARGRPIGAGAGLRRGRWRRPGRTRAAVGDARAGAAVGDARTGAAMSDAWAGAAVGHPWAGAAVGQACDPAFGGPSGAGAGDQAAADPAGCGAAGGRADRAGAAGARTAGTSGRCGGGGRPGEQGGGGAAGRMGVRLPRGWAHNPTSRRVAPAARRDGGPAAIGRAPGEAGTGAGGRTRGSGGSAASSVPWMGGSGGGDGVVLRDPATRIASARFMALIIDERASDASLPAAL